MIPHDTLLEKIAGTVWGRSYRLACAYGQQPQAAEDTAGEVRYRLLTRIGAGVLPLEAELLESIALSHFIRDQTRDQVRSERRSSSNAVSVNDLGSLEDRPGNALDPQLEAERGDISRRLWLALDRLRPRHRELLVRRHLLDQVSAQIAAELDCKEHAVDQGLVRARAALRKALIDVNLSEHAEVPMLR